MSRGVILPRGYHPDVVCSDSFDTGTMIRPIKSSLFSVSLSQMSINRKWVEQHWLPSTKGWTLKHNHAIFVKTYKGRPVCDFIKINPLNPKKTFDVLLNSPKLYSYFSFKQFGRISLFIMYSLLCVIISFILKTKLSTYFVGILLGENRYW